MGEHDVKHELASVSAILRREVVELHDPDPEVVVGVEVGAVGRDGDDPGTLLINEEGEVVFCPETLRYVVEGSGKFVPARRPGAVRSAKRPTEVKQLLSELWVVEKRLDAREDGEEERLILRNGAPLDEAVTRCTASHRVLGRSLAGLSDARRVDLASEVAAGGVVGE